MSSSGVQNATAKHDGTCWHIAKYRAPLCTALGMVFILIATVLLSACAIGNVGTLAAKIERAGNVSTVDMYSIGLHLRTRTDDSGSHLGYSHRKYVFDSKSVLEPGWYFFKVPLPNHEAVAQDLMTVGIELSTVAPVAGITLGYSHNRLHTRTPIDESVYLQYDNSTGVVKVEYCIEDGPCEIKLPSH
jgi:hypothetical protein